MTGDNATGIERFFIIHGHFYQPPRENPWLDVIERQPSAAPYHDWNERIWSECYRPNAFSRILDERGMIKDVRNNYSYMSFNFGPTLQRWLEKHHPRTAARVLEGDLESIARLGHGNALAQVYNHIIMPHASRRDQLTQIRWAKSFFKARFCREPEGIWLAETAINHETLVCLIEEGIRFVVLSPNQAESIRPLGSDNSFSSVANGSIDTRRPYRIFPHDHQGHRMNGSLDIFFFDEGLSRAASFENLLTNASILGDRIAQKFDPGMSSSQVITIATDGETFGHHKAFGDMCIAYLFNQEAAKHAMMPTNFATMLDIMPPATEVTLKNIHSEGTAWSCAHGTGRWIRDCGCSTGELPGWNQKWRGPLRTALDTLQKKIDLNFERRCSAASIDPWRLRDHYLEIADDPTPDRLASVLTAFGLSTGANQSERLELLQLLEAQKFILFAYTSCGWFFADVTGIETIQNIQYACRALQIGLPQAEHADALKEFTQDLDLAVSNLPNRTGKTICVADALPRLKHKELLAFGAAIQKTILPKQGLHTSFYGYSIRLHQSHTTKHTHFTYDIFEAAIASEWTGEQEKYGILISRKGTHYIHGWVLPIAATTDSSFDRQEPQAWLDHPDALALEMSDLFEEIKTELARHFEGLIGKDTYERYSLWVSSNHDLLDSLSSCGVELPPHLAAPLRFVFTVQWNKAIAHLRSKGTEEKTFTTLLDIWNSAGQFCITPDFTESIRLIETLLIEELSGFSSALDIDFCNRIRALLNIVDRFVIPISKSRLEDMFHSLLVTDIATLYNAYRSNLLVNKNKKELLIQIVQFARRMNFNTDHFVLT